MNKEKVRELYGIAADRIRGVNIGCFKGMDKPLFLVSDQYPGIWMEHIYDSVMYAKLFPDKTEYMINTLNLFMELQTPEGQLPCYIWDKAKFPEGADTLGYYQIQECVSFSSLCLEAYRILGDREFLTTCYASCKRWIEWLEKHRMTQNKGLIEMFVGYDTGHDDSSRLRGMLCEGNYSVDGVLQNASVFPKGDGVAPIFAVDMNCNYYGNLMSLSRIAEILGLKEESEDLCLRAAKVKEKLFEVCFDKEDCFFYDVDRHGNKRKIKSCTVFHLFLEKVLDKEADKDLIDEIYRRHISNPEEFATPYPFPSVAYNDPSAKGHLPHNSWGYFTQMLIALRCTLWMDLYGYGDDFDNLCRKTVEAWTEHCDKIMFGQELDPVTGVPSPSSQWYSSCMLFYIYASRRLGLVT